VAVQHSGRVLVALCVVLLSSVQLRHSDFFLFSRALHSGVSVGNEIGPEGAKALGDALKNNTTLTSLSLNLDLDCE
jgi:hypothetical protein